MPELSIITINYNNADGLQKTMQSVFAQSFTNYEFLIVDGASTDGSKNLLEKNTGRITFWVSEKDDGIYNAMNKGIKKASGEYVIFLNSGDVLYEPNVLERALPFLKNADLVYGDLVINEKDREWTKYYNESLDLEYFTRDTLPHQGSFIKKSLFEQIGLYDETLKIVGDWKFFLQAVCIYKVRALYINQVISVYDYTGISSSPEFYSLQKKEKDATLDELFPLHIGSIRELHALRKKKGFYESFEKDFFVQKYFGAKLKWKAIQRKFKNNTPSH